MAKINVTGLSVKDILNMDPNQLNKLNRSDLSAIASRLVSASNKRIRRLEKTPYGEYAPSMRIVRQRGEKFSVKGKDVNQLRNEIKQMRKFLNMKTSTVSGWKKVQKNMGERLGGEMTIEQTNKFWEVYHKLESQEGGLMSIIGDSDRIQKLLHQEVSSGDSDDIFQRMMDNLDAIYEEMMDVGDPSEDVSDVFSMEWDF